MAAAGVQAISIVRVALAAARQHHPRQDGDPDVRPIAPRRVPVILDSGDRLAGVAACLQARHQPRAHLLEQGARATTG